MNRGLPSTLMQSTHMQLATSPECQAITSAIVSLAKSLNKVVGAEGVATTQEQALVVAMGCDELQGFALSKPLSTLKFRSQFADLWVAGQRGRLDGLELLGSLL